MAPEDGITDLCMKIACGMTRQSLRYWNFLRRYIICYNYLNSNYVWLKPFLLIIISTLCLNLTDISFGDDYNVDMGFGAV